MEMDLPVIASAVIASLARLLLRQILLLLVVALAVFLLLRASPFDPVNAYLGAGIARVGVEQKAQIAALWGLDQPLLVQFTRWISALLQGDLGFSTSHNAPVAQVIAARLGPSLMLAGGAWALSGLLGFALGLWAASVAGSWGDRLIRFYCYLLAATPTFWLAILLLSAFALALNWAPICCAGPIGLPRDQVTWGQYLHHLALPLLALTLFGVAQIALHTRMRAIDILQSDFIALARSQGAGRFDILRRHLARNAALPALSVMAASMGEIFGGSILAEQVFAWPGLGRASVEAGMSGDLALLGAITLILALLVSSGNLAADLLQNRLDPRGGKR